MAKPDFRKTLRAIATAIQEDNLERLLSGLTVTGGTVAPRVTETNGPKGRAKRIRISGIRVSVRELQGKVGVRTGDMLKDVTRRANQKIGRVSFKIIPSPAMRARWFAFQAGTKKQVSRPTSGVSDARMEQAASQIAEDAKVQFVKAVNSRRKG